MSGFVLRIVYNLEALEKLWAQAAFPVTDISTMLRKVRAVVLRRGVPAQDVDDLVQEAFVRVESYARRHEVRSREAFMVTAAINLSRDQARHHARGPRFDDEIDIHGIVDATPRPDEQLLLREQLRRIASGLRRLDDKTQRCLLAKRLDRLTAAEIAEREKLSVAAVEKRIARALLFLARWTGEV